MENSNVPGVVAAGDRLTAAAGAEVLAKGGNAVDAAIAAMTTAFVSGACTDWPPWRRICCCCRAEHSTEKPITSLLMHP